MASVLVAFAEDQTIVADPDLFPDAARTRKIPHADWAAADAAMMSPERAPQAALTLPTVPAAVLPRDAEPVAPPTPTTLAGAFGSLNLNAGPPGRPRAPKRDPLPRGVAP